MKLFSLKVTLGNPPSCVLQHFVQECVLGSPGLGLLVDRLIIPLVSCKSRKLVSSCAPGPGASSSLPACPLVLGSEESCLGSSAGSGLPALIWSPEVSWSVPVRRLSHEDRQCCWGRVLLRKAGHLLLLCSSALTQLTSPVTQIFGKQCPDILSLVQAVYHCQRSFSHHATPRPPRPPPPLTV